MRSSKNNHYRHCEKKKSNFKLAKVSSAIIGSVIVISAIAIPGTTSIQDVEALAFAKNAVISINTKKSLKVAKNTFKGLNTKKVVIKVNKKMSKKELKKLKKALKKAGSKGKVSRSLK